MDLEHKKKTQVKTVLCGRAPLMYAFFLQSMTLINVYIDSFSGTFSSFHSATEERECVQCATRPLDLLFTVSKVK